MKKVILVVGTVLTLIIWSTTPELGRNETFRTNDRSETISGNYMERPNIVPWGTLDETRDTILSNNFTVSAHTFSTEALVLKFIKKSSHELEPVYYRQFDAEFEVCYREEPILKMQRLSDLLAVEKDNSLFFEKAILREFRVDMIRSSGDQLVLSAFFYHTETETTRVYDLIIKTDKSLEIRHV